MNRRSRAMKPLVTVIIASYCNLEGIYPTLQSILGQTYENIEIIFTDDGTPGFDEEISKLDEYISAHQKGNINNVVYNAIKVNGGTVKNVNSAITLSKGRYIKELAAEDRLSHPHVLQHYVHFMETHDSKVVFAKMRGVTLEGQYKYRLPSCEFDYELLRSYTVEQTQNRLFRRNFLPAPTKMIDAEVFRIYGLYPECTRLIEDYSYWLYLTAKGVKFDYMDELTVDYMLSGVSGKGQYSEIFMQDMLIIYDKYIFPYDKRFGIIQPIYNALKRGGLNYYITEAQLGKKTRIQRLYVRLKYLPFWLLVFLQNAWYELQNKHLNVWEK